MIRRALGFVDADPWTAAFVIVVALTFVPAMAGAFVVAVVGWVTR